MVVRGARSTRRDDGQAVLPVLIVVGLSAALLLGLAPVVERVVTTARARVAADAAALAGVVGGPAAAGRLAAANGAGLVSFRRVGSDVLVTVTVDGVLATARATDAP